MSQDSISVRVVLLSYEEYGYYKKDSGELAQGATVVWSMLEPVSERELKSHKSDPAYRLNVKTGWANLVSQFLRGDSKQAFASLAEQYQFPIICSARVSLSMRTFKGQAISEFVLSEPQFVGALVPGAARPSAVASPAPSAVPASRPSPAAPQPQPSAKVA